ncbi:MAG: DUF992 domain-containing protein [Hyphomicrobiales bacterium]|nr:DUF992 domain-containing protein [Hyphomicrobiales bacterium]MCP4997224.1 DUF992 domain-containing protein [Hyphomicrobiales bacterium]
MKTSIASLLVAAAVAVSATPAMAAKVKLGQLACSIEGTGGNIFVSGKSLGCQYTSISGSTELYTGKIEKFGLDIGKTDISELVWVVLAPSRNVPKGALSGTYVGASAEATVGVGAGANVLVGGFENSISLQPVNLQIQTGLNIAAGLSKFTLTAN